MSLLPKPYPDEVFGSIISRGFWHSGLSLKVLIKDLFGQSRSCSSFLMGSNLRHIAKACGMDATKFLHLHTVFPYATAYMPLEVRLGLMEKVLGASTPEESISSLTKNVSHGVPFRRLCQQCVQEDLFRYGESYWRRHHHLPGALLCREHLTTLRVTEIRLKGQTQIRDSLLPHMVNHESPRISLSADKLTLLSDMAYAALTSSAQPNDAMKDSYRLKSLELGFKMPSGDIASSALSREMQNFFGIGLLEETGCNYSKRSPWPELMVRKGTRVPFSTAKYVLMEAFLLKAKGFEGNVKTGHNSPGKKPINAEQTDSQLYDKLKSVIQVAVDNKERLTTKELLSRVGSWQLFRHKRLLLPRSAALILEFRMSENSERQLGGREYWKKRLPKRYGLATRQKLQTNII